MHFLIFFKALISKVSWAHFQNTSIHPRTDNHSCPEKGCIPSMKFPAAHLNFHMQNNLQEDSRNIFFHTWDFGVQIFGSMKIYFSWKVNKTFGGKDFWNTRGSKKKLWNPKTIFLQCFVYFPPLDIWSWSIPLQVFDYFFGMIQNIIPKKNCFCFERTHFYFQKRNNLIKV